MRDSIRNTTSTLDGEDAVQAFARFFARIVERYREDPDRLRIREIDRVIDALLDPQYGTYRGNGQNVPFGIVSIAWHGAVSTFSPELLGTAHPGYGAFAFGNVHTTSLAAIARDLRLRRIAREIEQGVGRCRCSCPYFAFCRGGAPANKLSELGRFDGTLTLFCQLTQIIVVETVLGALEVDLARLEQTRPAAE
jgi:uncharacterized protein